MTILINCQDSILFYSYVRVFTVDCNFFSDALEGYVHLLSNVTPAKNRKITYFDCHIQTDENTTVHAVCYLPEKRVKLQQAFQSKSPVKISGVKASGTKRFHGGIDEYTITKQAKVTPSLSIFQYNEAFANKLCTVQQALSKDLYEIVDLKVKVMTKEENKEVIVQNEKAKSKSDSFIADDTDTIKLVLWENIIDCIHVGKSYHLKNLKVRIFGDEKYLNTNESTVYDEIEDIKDVNLTKPAIQHNLVNGQCIAVQLKRTMCCIVCNCQLDETKVENEMITCSSCGNTTLEGMSKTKLVARITVLSDDKNIFKFTCFNDALQSLLNTTGCVRSLGSIPLEDLKKIILKSGPRKIIADKATQLIAQFLPLS